MNVMRKLVYSAEQTTACKASTSCQALCHFVDEETEAEKDQNEQVKRTKTPIRLHRQEFSCNIYPLYGPNELHYTHCLSFKFIIQ